MDLVWACRDVTALGIFLKDPMNENPSVVLNSGVLLDKPIAFEGLDTNILDIYKDSSGVASPKSNLIFDNGMLVPRRGNNLHA